MPYTIIYTEPPTCIYCGETMESWIALAQVHYHDECWAKHTVKEIFDKLRKDLGLPPEKG